MQRAGLHCHAALHSGLASFREFRVAKLHPRALAAARAGLVLVEIVAHSLCKRSEQMQNNGFNIRANITDAHRRTDGWWITIREGKTEVAVREVPIHPSAAHVIERRRKSSKDGYLFEGLIAGGPRLRKDLREYREYIGRLRYSNDVMRLIRGGRNARYVSGTWETRSCPTDEGATHYPPWAGMWFSVASPRPGPNPPPCQRSSLRWWRGFCNNIGTNTKCRRAR